MISPLLPAGVLVGKWGRGLGHFQLSSGLEVDYPPSLQTSAAGVVSSGPGACVDKSPAADVGPATKSSLTCQKSGMVF